MLYFSREQQNKTPKTLWFCWSKLNIVRCPAEGDRTAYAFKLGARRGNVWKYCECFSTVFLESGHRMGLEISQITVTVSFLVLQIICMGEIGLAPVLAVSYSYFCFCAYVILILRFWISIFCMEESFLWFSQSAFFKVLHLQF